jgi:hypothetical protein
MVQFSEQIRQIAQSVCDRVAALEPSPTPDSASASLTSPTATASTESSTDTAPTLSLLIDAATDAELQELVRDAARLRSEADAVVAATAGVIAKRSARELGYSGLAK